jgi:butyryl-CoA dehydrogenase
MARAAGQPQLAPHADALGGALRQVEAATRAAWATGDAADALANAVPYMQAFGHLVIAWTWLDVLLALPLASPAAADEGRRRAARYFFHYELPKIAAWLGVVQARDATCATMPEEAF